MSIHINRIYTRTGDKGMTRAADNSPINKTAPQLGAYAALEEINAALGVVIAVAPEAWAHTPLLRRIQNQLFNIGSVIAGTPQDLDQNIVTQLETAIDEISENLTPLTSFILPGGTMPAAFLHQARTTTRRAERELWAYIEEQDHKTTNQASPTQATLNPNLSVAAQYINRLSDLLFALGRAANENGAADVLWEPGA
ncbi:MAG: cob(I)yrinic acid a,c-diamide adenosyltransferase [Corynebacterium sp.]|nr:cob(I)yrinic acid a,c-diamide adenosyltransferase [Corynebacterium sp.]